MTTYVDACIAEAEAAGWSGAALQRLVIDPQSSTPPGFRARLKNANEIRGLIKITDSAIRAAGFTPEGLAEDFVAGGHSYETVRTDVARIMADADAATSVNTARSVKKIADPYAARAAEIDEHKAKARG